ncbi:hypothetical protein [Pseudomonas yamanorum]
MDSTETQNDSPNKLPPLGPEFITGNDAASWAHRQVSNKRDHVYAGLILKRAGRYVPTLPSRGNARGVDFSTLLNLDAKGDFEQPDGYQVYAFYSSRSEKDDARAAELTHWTQAQRRLEISFFSMGGLRFVIENRDFCPIYYLSGPHDSLIKYESSGSAEESHFLRTIKGSRASDVFEDFMFFIKITARSGVLRVVVPNTELGGKAGQIVEPWALNQPVADVSQSRQSQPSTQVFLRWQDAIRSALPPLDAPTQDSHFGYLLKDDAGEYVAMLPDADLKSIFVNLPAGASLPKGRPKLPSGFYLHAIYCSLAKQHFPKVPKEQWLSESFFTADVLAMAAVLAASDEPDLELYLRTNDGALLMYRCTGSEAQTRLFGSNGADIGKRLKDGTLSPSEFVRQVAGVGTLTVLEAGQVWDKVGVVDEHWRSFTRIHQSLSQAFVNGDDVARYLHYAIGKQRDDFYYAFILQRDDGRFVATPLFGETQWFSLWWDAPTTEEYRMRFGLEGYRVVAQFNRPKSDLTELRARFKKRTPSQLDFLVSTPPPHSIYITAHFSDLIKALYTSGPNGTLLKYTASGSRSEREFGDFLLRALQTNRVVVRAQGYDGTPEGLIKELVQLGELTVLLADESWYHTQGRVPATWAPQTPFTAAASLDAPLSWVFTYLENARSYAHDQFKALPPGRRVGFILKHRERSEYVVSDPSEVIGDNDRTGLFALSRTFPGHAGAAPALPPGFILHSFYYHALPDGSRVVGEPWLYESFIATLDLAEAVASARETGAKALYISTADRAQLGYEFSATARESALFEVLPSGEVTDNGLADELQAGTLTAHDLVLKVAQAGDLAVLTRGKLWDVAGPVDVDWRPLALATQPRLSPGFLQVEDAARYAHGQIGSQREREYCGYILQRPDGQYVATELLYASDAGRFVLGRVYPQDVKGRSLLPLRHVLKAVYGSSRGVSLLVPERLVRPGWSRDDAYLAAHMFSAEDVYTLIQNRQQVPMAYLSAAEDCLLAFEPGDSSGLTNVLKAVTPTDQGSPAARNLVSGTLTAPEWIRQVATAGSVRVVLGNPLWGASGLITEHWRPRLVVPRLERPEQVAYGQVCASAADAARALHARVDRGAPTQISFGFILKHRDRNAFVSSELVPAWNNAGLFALNGVFGVDDEGEFIYPTGYQLHALFYRRNWMPKGLSTSEQWLAEHFISAADLASATLQAKRQRETGALTGLPVFISTLDQALLQMQAPVSSTLFNPIRQPSGMFEDVQTLVASGQLTAVGFVNEVAKLSWLSVLVTNECWALTGKLDVSQIPWTAFASFMRRGMSPLFSSQADAVRYAHQQLGTQRDTLYGGLVLQRNGKFVATLAIAVLSEDFDPNVILPTMDVSQALLAPGWKVVGRYRSRAARVLPFWLASQENATYQNLFSTKTLETALKSGHLWTHEYLLTPDGSLIGFSTRDAERNLMSNTQRDEATQLLNQLETSLAPNSQAPQDPDSNAIEQQLRAGRKTPTELVNQLARVGTLQVIEGGPLWGIAKRILPGWMPALAYIAPEVALHAVADRALGPVYKHADDAARDGHQGTTGRGVLTFGLILKSSDNGHFVASVPVNCDDLKFSYDRVFLRGELPNGYSMHGLYLRLPEKAAAELPQAQGYEQLPAPALVRAVLSFLQVLNQPVERFLPLYVSCADCSLYRYQAVKIDPDWDSSHRQVEYLRRLKDRGSNDSHVLKLADSGELRVLDSSPFWDALLPRVKHIATTLKDFDTRLALGPLCGHPDDAARLVWQRFKTLPNPPRLGAILGNGDSDTFIAVQPVADPGPSVAVGLRPDTPAYSALFKGVMNLGYPGTSTRYPAGYKVMGVQQLFKLGGERQRMSDRYEEGLAHNFIDQKEIRGFVEMLRQDRIAGARYYFTPVQGALIVYQPSYHEDESQLLRDDWIDETTGWVTVKPSEVIRRLATSGKLTILEPDRFWQPRSQVARRMLHEFKEADQGV